MPKASGAMNAIMRPLRAIFTIGALLMLSACTNTRNAKLWRRNTEQAMIAEKGGDFKLAQSNYESAYKNAQDGMLGNEALSASLYDAGRMSGMQGNFEEAETDFRRSLALEEPIYGANGGHAYMRWFELARLYYAWGRYRDSVGAYQKAFPAALKLNFDAAFPNVYAQLLRDYADALDKAGAPERAKLVRKNAGPNTGATLEQEIRYYPSRTPN
jgi:tetratricopeptide (TPR) repeat protein